MYLPMQLTDWLLVEMALLLIGLNQNSLTKTGFNHPAEIDFHKYRASGSGIFTET